jgi:hypothetical protein
MEHQLIKTCCITTEEETVAGEEYDIIADETPPTIGDGKVGFGPSRATSRSIRTTRNVEAFG